MIKEESEIKKKNLSQETVKFNYRKNFLKSKVSF